MPLEWPGCSRREALGRFVIGAGLALSPGPAFALDAGPAPRAPRRSPVTTYFNDGLLADPDGQSPAWRRPRGYRGAGGIARLSEEERIAAGITL